MNSVPNQQNLFLKKSQKSNSTCDSLKKKCCKNPECPVFKKKCEIKSDVCRKLFEKKKLLQYKKEKIVKVNIEKEFEIIDKEESRKNNFKFNKDFITVDAFGFGMSNSCIQSTYSSRNITEARFVYDSLSVFSTFMAALSASTAIVDSVLINWDTRSRMIDQSTDSRSRNHYVR